MSTQQLEADYLVIGAGAMGLAFVDEVLMRDADATFIMVDKRAKPGGHWNDAYPFVSLHQPAAFYGVNSMHLGDEGAALASGVEVLAYFDRVMTKLTKSGRVRFFSMCAYEGNNTFRSTIDPDRTFEVDVKRRTVDASYMNVKVPSTTPPKYEVAEAAHLAPLNDLARIKEPRDGYVIIGAGKTGIDAVLFLLRQGVAVERIRWIMSNDSWLMERAGLQPGITFRWFVRQLRIVSEAESLESAMLALEREKIFFRIDPAVEPRKFRCATVDTAELAEMRRVAPNIVRQGRVERIDAHEITLTDGALPTSEGVLHVDCTADPLAKRPAVPVFDGRTITLQSLSMCQQVFSASLIGFLESRYDDDAMKNALSRPVPHPEYVRDYIPATWRTLANMDLWARKLPGWMRSSRLAYSAHDSLWSTVRYGFEARRIMPRMFGSLRRLYEEEFPDEPLPVDDGEKAGVTG